MQEYVKVSIIVPIFNAAMYLCRCLDSLVGQSLREIEIICVDDASTDDSYKILGQYAARDERIRILHSSGEEIQHRNMGQSVARNVGLKAATGEYILMVDADDWLELNAAEKLYSEASKVQLDILYFGFALEYENEEVKKNFDWKINHTRKGIYQEETISGQDMLRLQYENKSVCGTIWSAAYRRIFLHDNHIFFDEEVRLEDGIFAIQAMLCAQRTKCLEGEFYHYYRRNMSVTTWAFSEKKLMEYFMLAAGELRVALSHKDILPDTPKILAKWIGHDFLQAQKKWNDNIIFIDDEKLVFAQPWKNIAFEVFRTFARPEPSLRKFTNEELARIQNAAEVVLYGAGYVASRTVAYLHEIGVDRFKIAVTQKKQEFFMGNKIYTIRELCQNASNIIILLAVMPEKQPEMKYALESFGICDYISMI